MPGLYGCLAEALRTRHYSRRAEGAYLHWIRRFHNGTHPRKMAEMDVLTTMAYTLRIESWRSRSPESLDRFRAGESIESVDSPGLITVSLNIFSGLDTHAKP